MHRLHAKQVNDMKKLTILLSALLIGTSLLAFGPAPETVSVHARQDELPAAALKQAVGARTLRPASPLPNCGKRSTALSRSLPNSPASIPGRRPSGQASRSGPERTDGSSWSVPEDKKSAIWSCMPTNPANTF